MTDASEILQRFLGPKGGEVWKAFEREHGAEAVTEKVRRSWLLPRAEAGSRRWYAFVPRSDGPASIDSAEAQWMSEVLKGCVGVSFERFKGSKATLDPNDELEAFLIQIAGDNVFRVEPIAGENDAAHPDRAMAHAVRLWLSRPPRRFSVGRNVAQLLYDFRMALAVGRIEDAQAAARELKSGLVDAYNGLILEAQLAVAMREWSFFSNNSADRFRRLLGADECPPGVVRLAHKALYHARFEHTLRDGRFARAKDDFERDFSRGAGNYFRRLSGLEEPEIARVTALYASVCNDHAVAERLRELHPEDSILQNLLGGEPGERELLDSAVKVAGEAIILAAQGKTEAAEADLVDSETLQQARVRLVEVIKSQTLESVAAFLATVEALPLAEQQALVRSGMPPRWCHSCSLGVVPWLRSAREARSHEDERRLKDAREQFAKLWHIPDFAEEGSEMVDLIASMAMESGLPKSLLIDALPDLVQILASVESEGSSTFNRVVEDVIDVLSLLDTTAGTLEAARSLLRKALATNPEIRVRTYLGMMEEDTPRLAGSILDALLTAYDYPWPSTEKAARDETTIRVLSRMAQWLRDDRFPDIDLIPFARVLEGLVAQRILPVLPSIEEAETVEGRWRIVLVSYESDAMRRVESELKRRYRAIDVRCFDGKTPDGSYRSALRAADLVIVTWRAMSHPMFDAAQEEAPGKYRYAEGGASASILRAALNWAAEQAPQ